MANAPTHVPVTLTYVDHPEIAETCVDGVERIHSDGPTVRIEFVVNRINPTPPGQPATGQRHTACRLMMPITALPDLAAKVNGLLNNLVQQGVIKPGAPNAGPASDGGKPS